MTPQELRKLADLTPVYDQRKAALNWAADEIDKLMDEVEYLNAINSELSNNERNTK